MPPRATAWGWHWVRRVLELSDGTITVASTPGQGSTFTVELPLTPRQEENPA